MLKARPLFGRAELPTQERATSIRIAALCLAAEADEMRREVIGDMLCQVAAGTTLLQRRSAGQAPAVKVIMLAGRPLY